MTPEGTGRGAVAERDGATDDDPATCTTAGAEELGGGGVERIFLSPRLGVRATAERWRRVGRDLRDRDRIALDRLAGMAMAHASEAFYALDDPLEAAVLAVLLELEKGAKSRAPPL